MKIWELELEKGKVYKIINKIDENLFNMTFAVNKFGDLVDANDTDLTRICSLSNLMKLEFEEIMDWSKVPVDTKVLVSDDEEVWHKEYFSHISNTIFYTFDGGTSWNNKENTIGWAYCKLAQD